MLETMYEANGVGLAAPQVGVLKQIVVIDVGDGPIILINPGDCGDFRRADRGGRMLKRAGQVRELSPVRTMQRYEPSMKIWMPIEVEGEGLLARAFCHEIDHLDGEHCT